MLHLQWRAMQSLAIGAMWLCVMLFLLEGARPAPATRVLCTRTCMCTCICIGAWCACRAAAAPCRLSSTTVPPCAGRAWIKLMSRWLVQMAFSFIVVDVFVVYLRYNLYCAFKSRFVKRTT